MIKAPKVEKLQIGSRMFGGNAMVIRDTSGKTFLQSYKTIVASIDKTGKVHRHWDSRTKATSCHISSFMKHVLGVNHGIDWFYNLKFEPVC